MVEVNDIPTIRNNLWVLPFIGSILTLISLFTPSAVNRFGSVTEFLYMDGFYVKFGGMMGPSFGFINIPSLMIVGIISMIIIIICTIIMFISSLTHRNKEISSSWIVLGIILIGGAIYYIAGSQLGYMLYGIIQNDIPYNFWSVFFPSFGVIAPFITGGISIITFIISKISGKEEVQIKPFKDQLIESEPISQPIPIEEPHSVKFCPACGEKVPHAAAQFCPGCGYNLKS